MANDAVSIRLSSANSIALSGANVQVFAPNETSVYTQGTTDLNGAFAFVPHKRGDWRVVFTVPSDHGDHKTSLNVKISKDYKLQDYSQPLFQRYSSLIGVLGILIGIFGILAIIKSRKIAKT